MGNFASSRRVDFRNLYTAPVLKALMGYTVLDFSKLLPGPFCSMLLADMGCRVVRVELPYWKDNVRDIPPLIEGQGFCYWMANRNKESLCLDFKKPEGRKVLERLLARADVLLEGFRPGLMERLGLGYKTLSKKHPRLVYCSLTGYGQEGPMRDKAGHDLNFLAQSGLLGLGDSNGGLSFPPTQIADLSGSLYAAAAILAALLDRERSKKGRHIDISLADSVLSWLVLPAGHYRATGENPPLKGRWWNGSHPFYRIYRTKDGRHLAVGALERGFAGNLLRQMGLEDLEEKLGRRFDQFPREIAETLEAAFSKKTLQEWMEAFDGKDVCVTPVLSMEEALSHPQSVSRGVFSGGILRNPIRFPGAPFKLRRPPPALGSDGGRILRRLGYSAKAVSELKRQGLLVGRKARSGAPPSRDKAQAITSPHSAPEKTAERGAR